MHSLSVAAAAQVLLARVANNVGGSFGSLLDMLAQDLAQAVRIYGLDSRTQTYRPVAAEDLGDGYFDNGAAVLRLARGAVFTLMTVHRADFGAYLARLDALDAGAWDGATASSAAAATARSRAR
jgi:hypothetical protein